MDDEIDLVPGGGGPMVSRWMFELLDDAAGCPSGCCYCQPPRFGDHYYQRGCVTTDLPTAPVYGDAI